MNERIEQLEQAIREANDWVEAHEGVGLLYFMEQMGEGGAAAVQTIKEVLNEV